MDHWGCVSVKIKNEELQRCELGLWGGPEAPYGHRWGPGHRWGFLIYGAPKARVARKWERAWNPWTQMGVPPS